MALSQKYYCRPSDCDHCIQFGLSSRRIEPRRQRAFHRHNEIEFIFLERGGIDHCIGGRVTELRAGRLAVFWGAIPHAPIAIEPGTVVHRLTLPLVWYLQWHMPQAITDLLLAGETVVEADERQATADLAMFGRWHEDLRNGSAGRRKLVLLESEARLRRLLLASSAIDQVSGGTKATPGELSKVEQMTRYIAAHYSETLCVADIARDAGLNPNYAARLFRKACGRGLLDHVIEHRVSHAQRLLATTDAKIIDIAFESGFGSPGRFYSAFVKVAGTTPTAYRSSMGLPGYDPPGG